MQAIVAVSIIVFSAKFILINDDKQIIISTKKWISKSFITLILFGSLSILSTFIISRGVEPYLFTFYLFLTASLAFLLRYKNLLRKKNLDTLSLTSIATLGLIGTSVGLFNIFMFTAIQTAPNIGYVNVINLSSITGITLLSALLFRDRLTRRKMLGIAGITLGLAILFL